MSIKLWTKNISWNISDNNKADKTNVLELDNTTPFTPTSDYEPATKKYADDNAWGGNEIITYYNDRTTWIVTINHSLWKVPKLINLNMFTSYDSDQTYSWSWYWKNWIMSFASNTKSTASSWASVVDWYVIYIDMTTYPIDIVATIENVTDTSFDLVFTQANKESAYLITLQ